MANIKLVNINKIYPNGAQAVYDFNLDIYDKEFIVFVGPSGCGKTTTLRMIAGLEDITKGKLYIDNVFSNGLTPKERNISMVFQSYALFPHMTVGENIGFGLQLRGYNYDYVQTKIKETAEILGLSEYINKKPKVLSGGQRQRVALGRAIARNASVFLLDEPLSNLDAKLRVQMRSELISLHKDVGATFVYVTHDQVEAMTMASRIVVMNDGYIQQVGAPKEIYDNPTNMFVAGFIGTPPMNFIFGSVSETGVFTSTNNDVSFSLDAELKNTISRNNFFTKEIALGIRPEHILINDKEGLFNATITNVELLGSETNIFFKIDESTIIANLSTDRIYLKGENVFVNFNYSKILFFDPVTKANLRSIKQEKYNFVKQILINFRSYHEKKFMTYEDGLLLINAMNYYNYTKDDFYLNACIRYLDKTIAEDGSIRSYVLEDYNIDNILAGNVLFDVYEITKNNKYKTAISRLYSQLKTHPRTSDGSFWHKKRYPNQIWLDGLYMGQLFYLRAAKFLGEDVTSDSFKQFMNVKKYLLNEENGLYYHAYDETKTMQWASKVDGKSPNVWSRSIGWWLMAIVDCYKYFNKEQQAELKTIFKQAIDSILPHLDSVYNMMYQIVDKPSLNGNYLETSGSSMFAYSILKAVQDGILDSSYYEYGYKTIVGIDKKYLTEVSGEYILDGICKVAGLDNQARDGSEKYYLSEPISKNEIKGLSPYFNACLLIIKHNK